MTLVFEYLIINQKNMYSIFIDNSGSVSRSANYWNTVQAIIQRHDHNISQCYLWNSTCNKITWKQLNVEIKNQNGNGGTSPENVALEIVQKKLQYIILVTDGEVNDHNVQRCDRYFEEAAQRKNSFKIKNSFCYIVSSGNNELNMSVTCPFSRYCDSQIFTKKYNENLTALVTYAAQDYKLLDSLEEITLDNFWQKYDAIEGLIIALNMGKTGNIPLKNQLVSAKARLAKQISNKMAKDSDYSSEIRYFLHNKNFNAAIEIADTMTKKYFSENSLQFENKMNHLISLCGDLRGKYNIGEIKSNKILTAQNAQEKQINQEIEVEDLSQYPIECPIVMDEDIPQILVDECEPLLLGVEKYIVDDITVCPLRILNYPEIRANLKARLSTFIGVKLTGKLKENPFTRKPLIGGIPLGTHRSHVDVGNYTIAKMVSGGKILGTLNMYYAVIWSLIDEGEIEYLKPIRQNATEHLIYRLKNSNAMASMCGLAQFVNTRISTDIALWYCVNSGYLNLPGNRDTFRFHFFNIIPMIKMVKVLGYPIDEGLKGHLFRTQALLKLLNKFKKFSTNEKKSFKLLVKGLYHKGEFINTQNISSEFKSKEVCPEFILTDGEATEEQIIRVKSKLPGYCRKLSKQEIVYIVNLLDASKSASDIVLNYNLKVTNLPDAEVNWFYGTKIQEKIHTKFHPKTLRPCYYIDKGIWEDNAEKTFEVKNTRRLFKGCKYIESYVLKYKKLPEVDELIVFYYNRYVESDKMQTLPYMVRFWAEGLSERFNKVAKRYDIMEVVTILNQTRPIGCRKDIEKEEEEKNVLANILQ